MRFSIFRCLVICSHLALSACGLFQVVPAPQLQELNIPARWQDPSSMPLVWEQWLDSEELGTLINAALAHNYELLSQRARTQAATFQHKAARSPLWPSLDLDLSKQRKKNNEVISEPAQLGLALNWELDVWGRIAASIDASEYSLAQQNETLLWAQWSLAANVAKNWFAAIEAKQQQQLASQRIKNLRKSLTVIEDGYQHGVRSALDLYSAQAELEAGNANLLQRQQTLTDQKRRLQLLLGAYPDLNLQIPATQAALSQELPSTISSHLLNRRPDIKASWYKVKSQFAEVKVAQAKRLPRFDLRGNYGANNTKMSDVLKGDDVLWSALASISAPLFKGGQLAAEQQRQQALYSASLGEYKQLVLTALKEVEQTLDNDHYLRQRLNTAQLAQRISKQAETQALESFLSGVENITTWLQTSRSALDRASQTLQIESALLTNQVQLYLALGGGFEQK